MSARGIAASSRLLVLLLALAGLGIPARPALADDCILLPEDRVSEEIVVELAPGSDFVAMATAHGCTPIDWIPEIHVGLLLAPPLADLDALLRAIHDDRSRLADGDAYEVDNEDFHRRLEDPEGVQRTLDEMLPTLARSEFLQQPAALVTHVPEATLSLDGAGLLIAVLDTGITTGHPEIAGVLTGEGFSTLDGETSAVVPPNGADDDGDGFIDEAHAHGTHVAGLVHLVAPAASILPVRVLNDDGKGTSFTVAKGIVLAVREGADVINLSLGLPHDTRPVEAAIEHAAAHDVLVVAAAGNRGLTCIDNPADRLPVVAVAAVDQALAKPAWASCGPEVALTAPGVGTLSTRDDVNWSRWDGSSFAAPLVAGAAALVKQRFPGLEPWDVKRTLQVLVQPDAVTDPALDGLLGTGVLDLSNVTTAQVPETMRFERDASNRPLLWWNEVPGGQPADVARGLVSALWADDELTYLGDLTCVADDAMAGARIADPALPPPGEIFFYVLRADPPNAPAPGTPGPWGFASHGLQRVATTDSCAP